MQPATALRKTGLTPYLGNTIEPTLLVVVWVSQTWHCKLWKAVPITPLSCSSMGGGESNSRAKWTEELVLPLINYSTRESGLCAMPGQQGRADPEGEGVGDLILRTRKQENWPCPCSLLQAGNLPGQCRKVHPGGKDKRELVGWPILSLPGPRTWVLCWSTLTSTQSMIYWSTWRDLSWRSKTPKAAGFPQQKVTVE